MTMTHNPLFEEDVPTSGDLGTSEDKQLEDGDQNSAPVAKKPRLAEDFHGAVDAETSLLHLQVQDLLKENKTWNHHRHIEVDEFLHELSATLKSLPKVALSTSPDCITSYLTKVFSFRLEKPFMFNPPSGIQVVGSWAYHSTIGSNPIDVSLEIPSSCFDEKDQLNHRYFAKRLLYLAHIGKALRSRYGRTRWELFNGDVRRPVLVLQPFEWGNEVRLLPVISSNLFPLNRLSPDRNNLREARQGDDLLPTPYYNSSVLEDSSMTDHAEFLQSIARTSPAFPDACVLLRIWARNQHCNAGFNGLSGYLLSMFLGQLIMKGSVSASLATIPLFRAALVALSNPKTFSGGSGKARASHLDINPSNGGGFTKLWKSMSDVVYMDHRGTLNLARNSSSAALAQAQDSAKRTLEVLTSPTPEAFDSIFCHQPLLGQLFDYWYHAKVTEQLVSYYNVDQPMFIQNERTLQRLVAQALGDRARLVRIFGRALCIPPGDGDAKKLLSILSLPTLNSNFILLAVRVDASRVLRSIERGPMADDNPAASSFRSLWGDLSELRRFQDGGICEAVVWEQRPESERHTIADEAVQHVVTRHLPGAVVETFAGALDKPLERRNNPMLKETDAKATRACEAAAEKLGKLLRSLSGLTLRVIATLPLSPVLRRTAVFPPLPHILAGASAMQQQEGSDALVPRCLESVEIACQLEGSGRWPDNPVAYFKMKAALGVQLAQAISSNFGIEATASESHVLVLSDGFAFKLILIAERDLQSVKALSPVALGEVAEAASIASSVPLRVWHQGSISALSGENPAYEPSVRLAKRWIAAQLLSPHFRDETVECLVAHCFLSGGATPYPPPASRLSGFLQFLMLLADHPWHIAPILVDPNKELTTAERIKAVRSFDCSTSAMGILTPKDLSGRAFTNDRPSKALLYRASTLAGRSAKVLERALLEGRISDPLLFEPLFTTDLTEYDAVMYLRLDALPHSDRDLGLSILSDFRQKFVGKSDKHSRSILKGIPQHLLQRKGRATIRKELLVDFEPVPLFCSMLEERFGEVAVFCADYVWGGYIGIKWKPLHIGLKPEIAHCLLPKGDSFVLHVDGVIADMLELGAGLVERVETNS